MSAKEQLAFAVALSDGQIFTLCEELPSLNSLQSARIQSGYIAWVRDHGELYTIPLYCWKAFWESITDKNIFMHYDTVSILHPDDHKQYLSLWEEKRPQSVQSSLANITQIFTTAGEYVGAWLTCYNKDTWEAYWLWTDADYNTELLHKFGDVLDKARAVAGSNEFKYITYGNIANNPRLAEGILGKSYAASV